MAIVFIIVCTTLDHWNSTFAGVRGQVAASKGLLQPTASLCRESPFVKEFLAPRGHNSLSGKANAPERVLSRTVRAPTVKIRSRRTRARQRAGRTAKVVVGRIQLEEHAHADQRSSHPGRPAP